MLAIEIIRWLQISYFGPTTFLITPQIARFGQTSYQIANIGSIMLRTNRKMSFPAGVLFILGVGGLLLGWEIEPTVAVLMIAGIACIIAGIMYQNRWPLLEYTLSLRTPGGDIQALHSYDKEQVTLITLALEEAFSRRT